MAKTFHDYESMGTVGPLEVLEPPLLEAFRGSDIVGWYSMIEDQLQRMLDDQEASRNFENADRIRSFLNTWRDNEITGSMNIDEIKPLKAAAEQQAAVKWPLRNYFSSLRGKLRKLEATEVELPRGIDTDQVDPMAGGLGAGAPPMSPDFGPEEEAPADLGAEEEPGPEAGAGLEQPGEEKLDKEIAFAESKKRN